MRRLWSTSASASSARSVRLRQAKTNHGLGRARYLGRAKLLIQGRLTFFVTNAKRWVRLLDLRAAAAAEVVTALA